MESRSADAAGDGQPAGGRSPGMLPIVVLWGLLALELAAALFLCEGRLMYTLDDPYIHLALAENLADGHIGLNGTEPSAPSSSILWPFLLAPFSGLAWVEWVPLVLNLLFATATLWLVQRAIDEALEPGDDPRLRGAVTLFTLLAIPALNLVGLVFTGMEHSLQVLTAVLLMRELARAVRGSPARTWLLAAIVLGPLVRYENGALSVAALLWLWWNGERGLAVVTTVVLGLFVGAYSALLVSLGLYPLPSSVLAKSAAAGSGVLEPVLYGIYQNLSSTPGLLMSLALVAVVATVTRRGRTSAERRFALALGCALFLHLLVGRFGWYGRYEIYVWAAMLLGCLFLWRAPLRRLLEQQSLLRTGALAVLLVALGARDYVIILGSNAFAAQNVYRQHYQLGRLAKEVVRGPVAVNDLGWVAFQNDEYVLDLWGLASSEALEARVEHEDSGWVAPLAAQHGVRCAFLYEDWFPGLPESWIRVGELRMAGPRVTPADDVVALYALDPERAASLREELRAFRSTLPAGATLVLEAELGL